MSNYSYLKLTTYSGIFFIYKLSSAPPIALREFKFRDYDVFHYWLLASLQMYNIPQKVSIILHPIGSDNMSLPRAITHIL